MKSTDQNIDNYPLSDPFDISAYEIAHLPEYASNSNGSLNMSTLTETNQAVNRTCGIMINSKVVDRQVQQMTDTIRNVILRTHVPEDEDDVPAEEDSVLVVVNDCVNRHVEYILTGEPKENLGFDHYLKENFPEVQGHIVSDPVTMNYLEAKFAETTGILSECLAPAIEDLSLNGCAIESIENFAVGQSDSYYVLTGDNPDAPTIFTEADLPHQPVQYNPEENPYCEAAHQERERELQLAMLPPEDRQALLDEQKFTDYVHRLGEIPAHDILQIASKYKGVGHSYKEGQ